MKKLFLIFIFSIGCAILLLLGYLADYVSQASEGLPKTGTRGEIPKMITAEIEYGGKENFPAIIPGKQSSIKNTSKKNVGASSEPALKANGIVTNIWIYDIVRLDRLRENGIKYLFVDIGGTEKSGGISTPESDIKNFLHFISAYEANNSYDFILLAYSEVYLPDYDFDEIFKRNYVNAYDRLIRLGFDGLHVDIEAIDYQNKENYLSLLRSLKDTLTAGSLVTVYAGPLGSNLLNHWEWDYSFYKKVSAIADVVVVPGYDLGYADAQEYTSFLRYELYRLAEGDFSASFMFGVPTHKKYPETLANALWAYQIEINSRSTDRFLGIAVFAEWTMTDSDWATLENYLGKKVKA